MTSVSAPTEARHFAGQFGVQRLVDGRENALRQQPRDQIFARMPSFSARSFTEIPSVMVMFLVMGSGSFEIVTRCGGV